MFLNNILKEISMSDKFMFTITCSPPDSLINVLALDFGHHHTEAVLYKVIDRSTLCKIQWSILFSHHVQT